MILIYFEFQKKTTIVGNTPYVSIILNSYSCAHTAYIKCLVGRGLANLLAPFIVLKKHSQKSFEEDNACFDQFQNN